ncbi:PREDICTED: filamin-A-like isoform X1 [Branchiostoma belcheri]|uniref:Filamin-A-like isoform X1 n=2 Tax=Branchiostoma belcheri TaxID=7741 RepID=A0A6P4ZDJ7_BRABE|nr:PREDICTED: filamin-A-like isoform X1 [Branchiostoma belcheri]
MASTPEETSPYSMATADSDEETILQFTSSVYLRIRNSKTSLIDLNDTSSSRRPPSIASSVCGSVRSTRYDTITENPTDEQPQLSTDDQLLLPTDEHPQLSTDEVFKPTEGEVPTYPFSDSGVSSLEEVFVRDPEDRTEDTETEVEKDPNQVEKKKVLLDDIRALGQLGREDSSSESTLSIDESDREEEDTPVHSTEDSATEENVTESDPVKLDTELTVQASVQESSTSQLQEETIPEPVSASSSSSFAREEEEESEEGMSTKQAAQTHDARTSVLEDIRKIGEKRSPDIIDDQLQSKKSKPSYTSSESDDSLRKPPGYTPAVSATPAEEVQSSLPPGGANPPVREPQAGSHIPQSVLAGGKPKGEPTKPRGVQEGNVKKKASFFRKKGQSDEELSRQPSPPPKIRTSGPGVMDRIKTFFGRERTSYDLQQAQTDVGIKYGTSHTLPDEPRERKPLLELQEEAPKLRKADVTVVEDEENSLPTPTVVRSHQANSREPGTSSSSGAENLKGSLKKAAVPEVKAAPAPAINASAAGPTAALPTKEAKLERKTSSSSLTSASSLDLPKKKKLKKKERKSSTSSKSSVSSLSSVDDRKTGPMNMDAEDSNLPPSRVVGSKPSSLKMKTSPVLESTPPLEVQKPPSPVVNTAPPMATKKTPSPEVKASPPVEVQKAPPPVQKAPPPVKKASPMVQKTPPSVKKTPPPVKKTPPPVKKTPPLVQKTSPPVVKASPAVEVQRPPSPVKKTTPFDEVRAPFLAAFFSFRQSAHAFSSKKRYTVEKALAKRAWSVEKVDAPWPSQAKSFSPVEKVSTPFSPMNASPPILSSSSLPVQRPAARPAQLKKTPESPRVREPVSPVYVVEPAEPVKTTPPPVLPQANQVTQVETQSPAPPVNNSVSLQTARSPTEIEGARQSVLGNIKQLRKDSSSSSSSSSDSEEEVAPTTEAPAATPVFPTEATPTVVEEVRSAPPPVMEAPKDKSTFEKIKDKADDMFSKKTTLKAKRIEGREIDDVDQIKEILKNKKGAKIIIVSEDELTSSSSSSSDDEYEKPASPMPEQVAVATADEAHSAPPPSKLLNGEPETSGKVIVSGSGLGHVPVHRTAKFMVSAENVEELPMEIIVTGPRKDRLPCRYNDANGSIQVEYVPEEVGEHDISVKYNGTEVPGGPFVCHAYDITKIKVSEAKWDVGKDVEVPIDTSRVGQGNLSASVTKDGRDIGSKLIDQGDGKQMLSFNPEGVGLYNIGLTFNKTNVPVRCPVIDPNQVAVRGEGYRRGHYLPVGETVSFNVDTTESGDAPVVATVTDSVDRDVPCDVYKDGSIYTATYTPKEPGDHKVNVKFAGLTVASSPVTVHAYDVNRVSLGPLSKRDELGYVSTIVDTKKAGSGILNTSVTTKDETVPHNCDKLDTGKYKVSFQPKRLGQYEVHAEYNDVTVPGSPLVYENFDTSDIVVGGEGLGNVPVGKLAKFQVDASKTPGGDVVVKIAGPSEDATVQGEIVEEDDIYTVLYIPAEVGEHEFLVLKDDVNIKGSPFISHAYDPSKIQVTNQSKAKIRDRVQIQIDTTKAGRGTLGGEVRSNGRTIHSQMSSTQPGLYSLCYTADKSGQYSTILRFNKEDVPGSPYVCTVASAEEVQVKGEELVPVGQRALWAIDTSRAGDGEVTVKIAGPRKGADYAGSVTPSDQDKVTNVEYLPSDVGQYDFLVLFDGEPVKQKPFVSHAYDASAVAVNAQERGKIGKEVCHKVDTTNAGQGVLKAVVAAGGQDVPSKLSSAGEGLYDLTFTPKNSAAHLTTFSFNDEMVKGSPFTTVLSTPEDIVVMGAGIGDQKCIPVNKEAIMKIDATKAGDEEVVVKVAGPTERDFPCEMNAEDQIYSVNFMPVDVGDHKFMVKYGEEEVKESPFIAHAFDPSKVEVQSVPKAKLGQQVSLKIDGRNAGKAELTGEISKDGDKVPSELWKADDGRHLMTFLANELGTYNAHIRHGGFPVEGSPFPCKVYNMDAVDVHGDGVSETLPLPVNEKTTFYMETKGPGNVEDALVKVSDPTGKDVPANITAHNGIYHVDYTPREIGQHKVRVHYDEKEVSGSPYTVNVFDANRIRADPDRTATVNQPVNIKVDARDAGPGKLTYSVDPDVPDVMTEPSRDQYLVQYTPTQPGSYSVDMKYNNKPVPGTPFVCDVQAEPQIGVAGSGLLRGYVDEKATFDINAQNCKLEELGVRISNSKGFVPHEVDSQGDQHKVIYTPRDAGPHTVDIVYFGKHVEGSPFYPNISAPGNVQILGKPGEMVADRRKLPLTVDRTCNVELDASTAGPGTFKSVVRGPSGEIQSSVTDVGNDRHNLKFTPLEKGDHEISVLYAGRDIKHSPFRADVQEPDIVQAIDDQPVQQSMPPPVRAPSLASQPPRSPSQSSRPVEAPSPIPQPALVPEPAQVSPPEQVAQPAQVPPQAQVSPPEQVAQPAQVPQPKQVATEPVGDVILKGLPEYANAKTPFRVHVDTRPAPGGGTLASRCFGPSKSSDVQLYDFENGTYELKVTPKEKGRHTLEVVYDQKHAPGSPHVFEVGSKSDYKRVKVFGPGLNNGMINYYRGNFLCDTRGAGEGDLSVRIQGPKGAFKVRMNPLAENERVIAVSYDPTFPGNYDITVKWSDKHVPGSPFRVYLAPPSSEPMGQPEIPPMMQQSIPRSRGSSRY